MIVELLGKFYDNHSLSIVNRYLALELDKHIEKVYISPIDNYTPEAKIDADFLDRLEDLKPKGSETIAPDIQIRPVSYTHLTLPTILLV